MSSDRLLALRDRSSPSPSSSSSRPSIPVIHERHRVDYDRISSRPVIAPRFLDVSAFDCLHVDGELSRMIATVGLDQFSEIRAPAYIEPTLEFVSSFSYLPTDGSVKYRLMSRNFIVPLEIFREIFSFPTPTAVDFPSRSVAREFWGQIAHITTHADRWRPGDSREKIIFHLAFRLAHRIFSETLLARTETPQNV